MIEEGPFVTYTCDIDSVTSYIDTIPGALCDSVYQYYEVQLVTGETFYQDVLLCGLPADSTSVEVLASSNGLCADTLVTNWIAAGDVFETLYSESCEISQDSVWVEELLTVNGCDSTVLHVIHAVTGGNSVIQNFVCDFSQTGTVVSFDTLPSGCVDTTTTITSLYPSNVTVLYEDDCIAGVDSTVLLNQNNCDSLVITVTSAWPSYDLVLQDSSCNPLDTGIVVIPGQTVQGCDSTVTIITTLIQPDIEYLDATTCDPTAAGVDTLALDCNWFVTTTVLLPSDTTYVVEATCDENEVGEEVAVYSHPDPGFCDSVVVITTVLDPDQLAYFFGAIDSSTINCDEAPNLVFPDYFVGCIPVNEVIDTTVNCDEYLVYYSLVTDGGDTLDQVQQVITIQYNQMTDWIGIPTRADCNGLVCGEEFLVNTSCFGLLPAEMEVDTMLNDCSVSYIIFASAELPCGGTVDTSYVIDFEEEFGGYWASALPDSLFVGFGFYSNEYVAPTLVALDSTGCETLMDVEYEIFASVSADTGGYVIETWTAIGCKSFMHQRIIIVSPEDDPTINPPNGEIPCDVIIHHTPGRDPIEVIINSVDDQRVRNISFLLWSPQHPNDVLTGSLQEGMNLIDVSGLPAGTYYLQINAQVKVGNGLWRWRTIVSESGATKRCIHIKD